MTRRNGEPEAAGRASGAQEPPLFFPEKLEEALLNGSRRYTRADVARASGVPEARATQIWRALGFPLTGEDEVAFTDGDVQALLTGERFVETGLISADSETMMTRQLGHHLSRLAEWQVAVIWTWLQAQPQLSEPGAEGADFLHLVEQLLPDLEQLQNHVWRRHLAACAVRTLAAPADTQDTVVQAVGFADMVGYTRMTRGLGAAALDRVLNRFEVLVGDVIAEHRGSLVKTIGDEVLFTASTPQEAAEIALTLTEQAAADPDVPPMRTGVAYGSMLRRYGDVYGPVVNIAARLTSVARPNTVLVSEALAQRLTGHGEQDAYTVRSLRPVSVRGYSRLRSGVLRRRTV